MAKQYFKNERSEWVKYCFCHEKIKFISSSRRVMFFLLYRQKDIDKIIEGNDRNYVIEDFQRRFNTCLREWKLLSLYMFHRIIFLLLIVSSLFCNFNRCAVCFQSLMNISCRTNQNAARIKRFFVTKPLNKIKFFIMLKRITLLILI